MFLSPGEKLWDYISSLATDSGLVLYDLNFSSSGIKVFLDKADNASLIDKCTVVDEGTVIDETTIQKRKGSSVTSEDCSSFCRRLVNSFSVDGVDLGVGSEPSIEVSSPGLNRELRLPNHFSWAEGHLVKIVKDSGEVLQGKVLNFDGSSLKISTTIDATKNSSSKNKKNFKKVTQDILTDITNSELLVRISEIKRASVNY